MSSLAQAFNRTGGQPIEYEGRTLHLSYWLDVTTGDRLTVRFLRSAEVPVQGVGITAERCKLRVGDTTTKNLALWRDTAPDFVEVEVLGARRSARVGIMNQWRDEVYGTTMLGINNAAMDVQRQPDGSLLVRCSDGWKGPDFNDLVFMLTRSPESS